MSTADRLAQIKARLEAATAAVWFAQDDAVRPVAGGRSVARTGPIVWQGVNGYQPAQALRDAEFIAAARQDIPWLLDELAHAHTVLREMLREHDDSCSACDWARELLPPARLPN